MGEIVVELYPEAAPLTVKNFLQYVDGKYYDGTIFHRILPEMIQGGGITIELIGKSPNDPIPYEADNGLRNVAGTISMVRNNGDPDSATCMFFFNIRNNSRFYDHDHPPIPDAPTVDEFGYTVFGKVLQGMDVTEAISRVPLADKGGLFTHLPIIPVVISKVSVIN
ncbi:MAG: peptidylprolyl isomerase A [Planctomycetes bacterium]|nr:peptidylprolyl isomerase A [Planctomycetota bacterium]